MRRAIARGRIVPQSLSTDPRLGRLSLKAALLFPLMWINCDDQGRVSGDPDEIKYATCPNIDDIAKIDIPELLTELEKQGFLKVYTTSKTKAVQMLDWWEEQKLQWAYPSRYPAPEGWTDHLRYHPTPKEIITENWPPSGQQLAFELLPSKLPSEPASALPSTLQSNRESNKEIIEIEKEKEDEKEEEEEEGRLPSALGSTSPSPTVSPVKLLNKLTECYRIGWGTIRAKEPDKVIPRPPDARIDAQLRDLAKGLSSAGGCPLEYIDQAFKDAAGRPDKMHISYVRAILLAWLGLPRSPP
ncbi:hypothetical protein ES703_95877 [subsurface metagenome]